MRNRISLTDPLGKKMTVKDLVKRFVCGEIDAGRGTIDIKWYGNRLKSIHVEMKL